MKKLACLLLALAVLAPLTALGATLPKPSTSPFTATGAIAKRPIGDAAMPRRSASCATSASRSARAR